MALDALTTAIFVMGLKKSAPLLSSDSVQSVIVSTSHDVFVSGGIKDAFVTVCREVSHEKE
jgi:thiamine biosynthesis lipoprotein ApbE